MGAEPALTPFEFRFRVRYPECDAQGVVFNARYGDYADLSVTEFLRPVVGGYKALMARGLETQVVRLLIEWQGPARFDEVLSAQVRAVKLGNTSFTLGVVLRAPQRRSVATCEITYVLVDARTFTKTPLPADLRDALERGAPGVITDQSGASDPVS